MEGSSEGLEVVHLRRGGVSVVALVSGSEMPRIAYWGKDLGDVSESELAGLPGAGYPGVHVLPASCYGGDAEPALAGSYDGVMFSPDFGCVECFADEFALRFSATDASGSLRLSGELELEPCGLVRVRARVENLSVRAYGLESLTVCLPVPAIECEVLDQAGGWGIERMERRHALTQGVHQRSIRNCRQQDGAAVHGTLEPGTTWRRGSAHLVHVGWSGNTRTQVELTSMGERWIRAGEMLYPGEVFLGEGESYETPWVYGSCGEGLDEVAGRFHEHVRALPSHPTSPRPVTLNTWEAVRFAQSEEKLARLAELATSVGCERFVVDDGWFSTRRDDTSGLGDWWVSDEVWPNGLASLSRRVHELGMQFGLWFEPECANTDSEVARNHPEWLLSPLDHRPLELRSQQSLNLAIPECFDYVLSRMRAVISENDVDYVKWDQNRDLWEAADQRTGRPGYHAQTVAYYRLLDALRAEFPALEIESCMSGGGRVDFGVMERVQRVWGSDMLDPVERWNIHDGIDLLLPPEEVGAHIGKPMSRATGRVNSLSFRAATSLFYHLGVEWDLTEAEEAELRGLAAWIAAYKSWRGLFSEGEVVHTATAHGTLRVRGVVSRGRDTGVFAFYAPKTWPSEEFERVALPGIDPKRSYRVRPLPDVPQGEEGALRAAVAWWGSGEPLVLPGSVLASWGLVVPRINPEQAQVVLVEAV